ncbi:unnamed protein product [Mytilus coruscus]|uniref:Uncharacterized protein n=1 Tax=Mytilus coruscus TaxID=42192 RepID=A0A6J8B008_MYTCO|nr:unnamed protein product [Mytilus coruscus]
MKVAIVFLAILPFILSASFQEQQPYKDAYNTLSHEERLSVHDAYEKVKHFITSHGKELSGASCSIVCASATALETMGLSAPLCVAACGLLFRNSPTTVKLKDYSVNEASELSLDQFTPKVGESMNKKLERQSDNQKTQAFEKRRIEKKRIKRRPNIVQAFKKEQHMKMKLK